MRKPFFINMIKWNVSCSGVLVSPYRREGGVMNRLILRSLITASLLLVLLSVPSIASADSILWTITGVPGVTGSFIFNGTTYSNISIITPLNPTAPGYTGVLAGSGPTATG